MENQGRTTPEGYILAKKYNRFNRKGQMIQKLIREGWQFTTYGPGLFVLEKTEGEDKKFFSVWGSTLFPKTSK